MHDRRMSIINIEPCNDLPIVMFSPDPEPTTAIGSCPCRLCKTKGANTKSTNYARCFR